jgi:Transposase DDE domain
LDLGEHLQAVLDKLPLLELARQSQWMERTARKITPLSLVTAALLLITQPQISLTVLAVLVGLLSGQTISKQSIHERLDLSTSSFLKAVLGTALGSCLRGVKASLKLAALPFARILVQDSSTIKLNEKLASVYPGGANQHGTTPGVLRLQAVFDLLSQRWLSFSLSPYVRNDQKASPDLLPLVRKNDLVLRDLGYFAIKVLEQIVGCEAFFLSRFYFRTAVFDLNGRQIDLLDLLRRHGKVDRWVLLGKNEKLRVRLVAVPVPAAVANERRRKARAHLQNRCQLSKEYLALQNWSLYVTNVGQEILSAQQVMALYGQRWQIEIIFKGWKSHFNLEAVSNSTTRELLELAIYGKLIFITLTHPLTIPSLAEAQTDSSVPLFSRLKIDLLTSQCLLSVVLEYRKIDVAEGLARQMNYHGRYEKRKRVNIWQKLFSLS